MFPRLVSRRYYSDFIKNLPRVGGEGGSKGNRFANQYKASDSEKPRTKNWGNFQNQRTRSPPKSGARATQGEPDKTKLYNEAREALREKQRQQMPIKKSQNSTIKRPSKPKPQVAKIKIQIPTFVTVSNLATVLGVPLNEFLKKLQDLGFENMRHNFILDKENAALIADDYGFDIIMNDETGADLFPVDVKENLLRPRAPVVTIMGHVDHGKTTILDYLRKSSIVKQEHGGITQHIGAFSVITPISKKKITFLDTPGHAAFLKMRERGAIVTDIVILVVAADDSVMPQTVEAIKHAQKSGVPMVVAVNKCDKPGVNVDKVLADLSSHGIDVEDYGGETQTVRVSGKTGLNMEKLEEAVITLSEMNDFKAEVEQVPAEGWVIESHVAKGMGNVATALVRRGTMKVGSFVVAGTSYCKIRGMKDENGKVVKAAGPSTPVQIWGWKDLPEAGDQMLQAPTEQMAKKVCENRIARQKQIQAGKDIDTINQKRMEEIKELERQERANELKLAGLEPTIEEEKKAVLVKYIIRSDVFGSAEAIKECIDGLGNEEVRAVVVSHEAGLPSESDVELAKALDATILCFNMKTPKQILAKADRAGVAIQEHNVIYHLIEQVTEKLTSLLPPRIEVKIVAEVEIKDVFTITSKSKSKLKIAGCKVTTGLLKRSSKVRVIRGGKLIYTGTLSSLKHVKDDISEAKKGNECGIGFDGWDKFQQGDRIEAYEEITHQRYL